MRDKLTIKIKSCLEVVNQTRSDAKTNLFKLKGGNHHKRLSRKSTL